MELTAIQMMVKNVCRTMDHSAIWLMGICVQLPTMSVWLMWPSAFLTTSKLALWIKAGFAISQITMLGAIALLNQAMCALQKMAKIVSILNRGSIWPTTKQLSTKTLRETLCWMHCYSKDGVACFTDFGTLCNFDTGSMCSTTDGIYVTNVNYCVTKNGKTCLFDKGSACNSSDNLAWCNIKSDV